MPPIEYSTLASVVEPQLLRTLGDLGFLDGLSADGAVVTLVLPVLNWPQREYLENELARLAPDATITVRGMNDDERLGLRNYLRGSMSGENEKPKFLERQARPGRD